MNEAANKSEPILRKIAGHITKLAEIEFELVKAQGEHKLQQLKQDTNRVVLAYMSILLGFITLIAAVTFSLKDIIPVWAVLLIFGISFLSIGIYGLKKVS